MEYISRHSWIREPALNMYADMNTYGSPHMTRTLTSTDRGACIEYMQACTDRGAHTGHRCRQTWIEEPAWNMHENTRG